MRPDSYTYPCFKIFTDYCSAVLLAYRYEIMHHILACLVGCFWLYDPLRQCIQERGRKKKRSDKRE